MIMFIIVGLRNFFLVCKGIYLQRKLSLSVVLKIANICTTHDSVLWKISDG